MPMEIKKTKTCSHFSIQKTIRVLPKSPLFQQKVDHTPLFLPQPKNRFLSGNIFWMQIRKQGGEKKTTHEKKRNRHFRRVSKSNKWPPPCRAAAVSIFFVHYIRGKHMVLRAGTEHFLPCTVPAQNLYARSSLLADCSWQSLAEAAASETSCWAGAKFISRWILRFMAPGKQGQPDGVTLEGFTGSSFSDPSEHDALAF